MTSVQRPLTVNILFVILLLFYHTSAQELKCTVQIETQQIQSSDKQIFKTLKTAIEEFMNNRKWSNDAIKNNERIECTIVLTIGDWDQIDRISASAIIQSSRPVYGTTYHSPLMNFQDKNWEFRYLEHQPLEYIETEFGSNLTSLLAFYAYIIIGLDYDSFSPEGGTKFLQKAQTVVDNAQNVDVKGWKPYESYENKYWIIENLLNPDFKSLRTLMYNYHRKGFDDFGEKDMQGGRKIIKEGLLKLKQVKVKYPNAFIMTLFFNAKAEELTDLFLKSNPQERMEIANLLDELDPANLMKYQKLRKG